MAHSAAWGCGPASDETDDRFGDGAGLVELFQVLCCFFFHRSPDLSDEYDPYIQVEGNVEPGLIGQKTICVVTLTFGCIVFHERLENINVLSSRERVTTNAHT
jgi:hypothetical protein